MKNDIDSLHKVDEMDKKDVDVLFNKNIKLVNYKLKTQYINIFNGDYDECEQELLIQLWKACQGWFKNKIYLRGTTDSKYKTPTSFSYHYYGYVRGYMQALETKQNNKVKKDNKIIHDILVGDCNYN